MKRFIVVTVLVIAVALPALAQRTEKRRANESKAQQELMKLEREWGEAVVKRDIAFLNRIEADDFVLTDPTGAVLDKKGDAEQIRSGELALESFKLGDMKVRVYGNTAVATGETTIKGKDKGEDVSGAYRFTDVFVKRDGRWQCVASQLTRVAKR